MSLHDKTVRAIQPKGGRSNKSQPFNQTVNQRQFLIGGRFFFFFSYLGPAMCTKLDIHVFIIYLIQSIGGKTRQTQAKLMTYVGFIWESMKINTTSIGGGKAKTRGKGALCCWSNESTTTTMMMMCILSAGIHCVFIQQYQHNMPNKAGTPIKCVQDKHWVSG